MSDDSENLSHDERLARMKDFFSKGGPKPPPPKPKPKKNSIISTNSIESNNTSPPLSPDSPGAEDPGPIVLNMNSLQQLSTIMEIDLDAVVREQDILENQAQKDRAALSQSKGLQSRRLPGNYASKVPEDYAARRRGQSYSTSALTRVTSNESTELAHSRRSSTPEITEEERKQKILNRSGVSQGSNNPLAALGSILKRRNSLKGKSSPKASPKSPKKTDSPRSTPKMKKKDSLGNPETASLGKGLFGSLRRSTSRNSGRKKNKNGGSANVSTEDLRADTASIVSMPIFSTPKPSEEPIVTSTPVKKPEPVVDVTPTNTPSHRSTNTSIRDKATFSPVREGGARDSAIFREPSVEKLFDSDSSNLFGSSELEAFFKKEKEKSPEQSIPEEIPAAQEEESPNDSPNSLKSSESRSSIIRSRLDAYQKASLSEAPSPINEEASVIKDQERPPRKKSSGLFDDVGDDDLFGASPTPSSPVRTGEKSDADKRKASLLEDELFQDDVIKPSPVPARTEVSTTAKDNEPSSAKKDTKPVNKEEIPSAKPTEKEPVPKPAPAKKEPPKVRKKPSRVAVGETSPKRDAPKPVKISEPKETKPAKSSEPKETKPAKSSEPKETKPAKSSEPKETKPVKISEPKETKPVKISEPKETKPAKSSEPKETKPAKSSEAREPSPATSSDKPVDTSKSSFFDDDSELPVYGLRRKKVSQQPQTDSTKPVEPKEEPKPISLFADAGDSDLPPFGIRRNRRNKGGLFDDVPSVTSPEIVLEPEPEPEVDSLLKDLDKETDDSAPPSTEDNSDLKTTLEKESAEREVNKISSKESPKKSEKEDLFGETETVNRDDLFPDDDSKTDNLFANDKPKEVDDKVKPSESETKKSTGRDRSVTEIGTKSTGKTKTEKPEPSWMSDLKKKKDTTDKPSTSSKTSSKTSTANEDEELPDWQKRVRERRLKRQAEAEAKGTKTGGSASPRPSRLAGKTEKSLSPLPGRKAGNSKSPSSTRKSPAPESKTSRTRSKSPLTGRKSPTPASSRSPTPGRKLAADDKHRRDVLSKSVEVTSTRKISSEDKPALSKKPNPDVVKSRIRVSSSKSRGSTTSPEPKKAEESTVTEDDVFDKNIKASVPKIRTPSPKLSVELISSVLENEENGATKTANSKDSELVNDVKDITKSDSEPENSKNTTEEAKTSNNTPSTNDTKEHTKSTSSDKDTEPRPQGKSPSPSPGPEPTKAADDSKIPEWKRKLMEKKKSTGGPQPSKKASEPVKDKKEPEVPAWKKELMARAEKKPRSATVSVSKPSSTSTRAGRQSKPQETPDFMKEFQRKQKPK